MKKILLLFFFCNSVAIVAQVTNEGTPRSWAIDTKTNLEAVVLSPVDIQKIKIEDDVNDKIQAKPYRIGVLKDVDLNISNSGEWTQLPNGDRIWKILIHSKDALNMSVIFDRFYLPPGANIYLYNKERSDLLGAYTDTQNNKNQVLGTWMVKGDNLWIEYYEPKEVYGKGQLHISSVMHVYRLGHTYQKGYYSVQQKSLNSSGVCNHDVDCPIGADFASQRDIVKKAVAFLVMPDPNSNSAFICSGALVNNTDQDKTPYFLTANHCLGTTDPATYSMRFNWISPNPVCGAITNSTQGPVNFTISGATLKAKNERSDFMLLQINQAIDTTWDVTFAGWDRSETDPVFEVGIHHPDGDIMKICRDDTGAIKKQNTVPGLYAVDTWEITTAGGGWEIGVTEGGSSGSPLFDQNGRIIGQLYGGGAACNGINNNGQLDFYGRFGISWNAGGTAATELKDWLDSSNTGLNTLDALENVLAVNDEFLQKNITLFPNPSSGAVQIKVQNLINDLSYKVYNTLGQILVVSKLQNNEIIDLSNFPNDVYFIKITEVETNKSIVKKIVLNK